MLRITKEMDKGSARAIGGGGIPLEATRRPTTEDREYVKAALSLDLTQIANCLSMPNMQFNTDQLQIFKIHL